MKRSEIKEHTFVKYDGVEILFICGIARECLKCDKIKLIVKRKYVVGGKYFYDRECFYIDKLSLVKNRPEVKKKFLEELLKE